MSINSASLIGVSIFPSSSLYYCCGTSVRAGAVVAGIVLVAGMYFVTRVIDITSCSLAILGVANLSLSIASSSGSHITVGTSTFLGAA